ncbi:trypsin-2-like [Sabethes cyaneus]|uniref:trypsin-2-like n=1 Tax=Sabethes cyaneus TaxID=53552 RepID=UPI00237ECED1|nr:trypsin-2-like [Sabethes cyaneus]
MIIRLIVCTSAALIATATGAVLDNPILKGGIESSWGEFSSAGFIRTPFLSFCGVTVIHPEVVLTLAQCVYDEQKATVIDPSQVEVIAGDLNIAVESSERQRRDVLQIVVHENYTAYNHRNDIALLRVDRAFWLPSNTVEVATRRRRIVPNGAVCQLPGWSMERSATSTSTESDQKYLDGEILDRDTCNQVNVHAGAVRENMICGGNLLRSTNAPCSGNLGSPLYCEDELTGLLSFGVNCGAANDPPVFVQMRFFNRWIEEQLLEVGLVD